MQTVAISGGLTVPEDKGTGLGDVGAADYTSAGHIAGQHAKSNITDYVESGIEWRPDNVGGGATGFDVGGKFTAGLAHIWYPETVQVQDNAGVYDNDWEHGISFAVQVPETTGFELDFGNEYYIYLTVDLTVENKSSYKIVTAGDPEPDEPSLKVWEVDLR